MILLVHFLHEIDKEINDRFNELKASLESELDAAKANDREKIYALRADAIKAEIRDLANERLQDLIDGYRAGQITETYLRFRNRQLVSMP